MKLNNEKGIANIFLSLWCMTAISVAIGHFGFYQTGLGGVKDGVKGKLYVEGRKYNNCEISAHYCNVDDLAFANYKK